MYDGIPADIPAIVRDFGDPQMVAGYVDGIYAWSQADWDQFPKAAKLRISAIPGSAQALTAHIADCETGDYTPASAAAWAAAKKAKGEWPTIYANLSNVLEVRQATGKMVLGADYDIWLAWYNGDPAQYVFGDGKKVVAKQYISTNSYDKSEVYRDSWPDKPTAPPPPKGPFRHVVPAGNTESLWRVCVNRNVEESAIISLSLANLDAGNTAAFNAYLAYEKASVAIGHPHPPMGEGFVYFTENP